MRRVCVVTGTRAEYGLLYPLMKAIQADADLHLQVIATGMHLAPEYGFTYRTIEDEGFAVDAKVEMLLSSDSAVGIAKSVGLATIGFADAFERLKPDLLVLLGDRYEILAAAQTALVAQIPIAHLAGGDSTEGAYDEAIRHSLTKMSHLHFVTNEVAARRVRQLGEDPQAIFNVGSPGIDQIRALKLLDVKELEQDLGFSMRRRNVLVTFHPVTLEQQASTDQFAELLAALDSFGPDLGIILTRPNADNGSRALIRMIETFVSTRPNAKAFASLGQLRYFSTIKVVDAVIGNSSSGLYEVPSFKKPTVNIGDRQKGRLQANSVINCAPTQDAIRDALQKAFELDCSAVVNPYGDGTASERILQVIKQIADPALLLKKHFHDMESPYV